MKRQIVRLVGALAAVVVLAAPGTARAHPLGNFTVNQYSRLEPAGDGVRIAYVLDLAEIPTFQEKARIDADRDGRVTDAEREEYAAARTDALRRNLHLTLDGTPLDVHLLNQSAAFSPGQGGLETLRLEARFVARPTSGVASFSGTSDRLLHLAYRDDNEPGRLGWREIVARPGPDGARIEQSTVPTDDQSDELRQYPDDLLSSPLDVREARLAFVPDPVVPGHTSPNTQPATTTDLRAERSVQTASALLGRDADAYAALAAAEDLSLPVILLSLLSALVLGAVHALSPGHGKTVVAAYLVGSRGTARHALFLGATVTTTHTIGVYALGLVTLYLSHYILPERLYPVLEVISGLLVVSIGGWLLLGRLRGALAPRRQDPHDHAHAHGHPHDHADPHHPGHPHADGEAHPDDDAHPLDHYADQGHEPHHDHHADHAHGRAGLTHSHAGLTHSHGGSTHSHLPPGADGRR